MEFSSNIFYFERKLERDNHKLKKKRGKDFVLISKEFAGKAD